MLALRQPVLYEINDVHCSAFQRLTALQFDYTTCYAAYAYWALLISSLLEPVAES